MRIGNRRAYHDYQLLEKIEAGLELTGPEVKSVKEGHLSLEGSFVKIIGTEAYLVNAQIHPYSNAPAEGYDPKRTRKLLLHKKEIMALKGRLQQSNLTLIPLSCYTTSHSFIKLEIALARGKKQYEKREALKRKDLERQVEEELRGKI
ncbi:MAG: SsrA-binding protein SmpB [Patescibacteria group bacterium]|nr:SsrA-binding protein SmpB [Patescibacteria group bacterium]MCL5095791.1 SsrA-binding protein SmpB [Patescibacteria group bacterium]